MSASNKTPVSATLNCSPPARALDHTVSALAALLADEPVLSARLRLVRTHVAGRVAFSTSLGIEDQAIIHAIAEAKADIDVFTLDTGRLFPETIETIAETNTRYGPGFGLNIRVLSPDATDAEALVARDGVLGFRSSIEARKACCDVRKVKPLARGLDGASGWITGLRQGQSSGRTQTPLVEWDDARRLIKINPIADWSLDQLGAYIEAHDIPINALHAQGFPSIGCQPCTRALQPGEDIRAGRWWWEQLDGKECGLHNRPNARVSSP
jgi:phosphoadenosine phosphosulfate reductase